MLKKSAYICGPLTELPDDLKQPVKDLYSKLGDACLDETGIRAFVPHEHFDPIIHAQFSPAEIDKAERHQVCQLTNCLIVVALEPTWGGGIEVEMANRHGIPALILKPDGKRISRLLLGNPAIQEVVEFSTYEQAIQQLKLTLRKLGLVTAA